MGTSIAVRFVALALCLMPTAIAAADPAAGAKSAPSAAAKPPQKPAAKPAAKNAGPPAVDISAGILAGETPAFVRIEKALSEPTELKAVELPLTDLVDFFSTQHHLEIVIDNKALEEAGVALDTPVSRQLKNISLRSALRLALRDLELTYTIRDEVLLITTVAEAETIMQIRVYPVGDLPYSISSGGTLDSLIDMITGTVAPTTWSEVGGAGSMKRLGDENLVVSQTQEVHEEIRDLLVALRKTHVLTTGWPKDAAVADPNTPVLAMYRVVAHPRPFKVAANPAPSGGTSFEVSVNDVFHGSMFLPTGSSAIKVSVLRPPEAQAAAKPKPADGDEAGNANQGIGHGLFAAISEMEKPAAPQGVLVSAHGLADDLVRVIPQFISPESWQGKGGAGSIASIGSGLVVRQTPHVQREIACFLQTVDSNNRRGMMGMN